MELQFCLSYSGAAIPKIDTILTELLKFYISNTKGKKNEKLIFPEDDTLLRSNTILAKTDVQPLVDFFDNLPFINIEFKEDPYKAYSFPITIRYNQFLGLLLKNYLQEKRSKQQYSFSDDLFKKTGNNNLDIIENTESAGLMFSL